MNNGQWTMAMDGWWQSDECIKNVSITLTTSTQNVRFDSIRKSSHRPPSTTNAIHITAPADTTKWWRLNWMENRKQKTEWMVEQYQPSAIYNWCKWIRVCRTIEAKPIRCRFFFLNIKCVHCINGMQTNPDNVSPLLVIDSFGFQKFYDLPHSFTHTQKKHSHCSMSVRAFGGKKNTENQFSSLFYF